MDFILASTNQNKILELSQILSNINLKPMDFIEIDETGKTFEENAMLKARTIYNKTKMPTIADDSGLCVSSLNDMPGIFSARYSGGDYHDNNIKLLANLKNKTDRCAKFVCVLACILECGKEIIVRGEILGEILDVDIPKKGFGYNSIFYCNEYKQTFHDIDENLRNQISHRAIAANKLKILLDKNFAK